VSDEVKKTYGQKLNEHWAKPQEMEDDVREYGRVMGRDIMKNVHDTAFQATKCDVYKNKDFYVVLMTKTERMGGVPRTFVMARQSCPSAVYEQSVWKYHHLSQSLEYLWTIPDRFLYWDIVREPEKYLKDKEYAGLAKFVLLMESGELMDWIIKENGEKPDGIIQYKDEGAS
jgi:hypothetical protein